MKRCLDLGFFFLSFQPDFWINHLRDGCAGRGQWRPGESSPEKGNAQSRPAGLCGRTADVGALPLPGHCFRRNQYRRHIREFTVSPPLGVPSSECPPPLSVPPSECPPVSVSPLHVSHICLPHLGGSGSTAVVGVSSGVHLPGGNLPEHELGHRGRHPVGENPIRTLSGFFLFVTSWFFSFLKVCLFSFSFLSTWSFPRDAPQLKHYRSSSHICWETPGAPT